jgi:DNA polymerase (family 10)
VDNAGIAALFDEIAELLAARKDNIFKIRAYRKAARSIEALDEPVDRLAAENRLAEIDGAGEAIQKKLAELAATGKLDYYERLKAESAQ